MLRLCLSINCEVFALEFEKLLKRPLVTLTHRNSLEKYPRVSLPLFSRSSFVAPPGNPVLLVHRRDSFYGSG